jgi:hypothetical protein
MVYKRFNNLDYVIKTIVHPSDKHADIYWFIRERAYPGTTEYKILFQSKKERIPLQKGNAKPNDLWSMARNNLAAKIEKRLKTDRDKLAKETEAKAVKEEVKAEEA